MGPWFGLMVAGCTENGLTKVEETTPEGLRAIEVAPDLVDFGVMASFTPTARTVTVTSVGDEPVAITAVDIGGSSAYSVSWAGSETSLAPGESTDLLVTYAPQSIEDEATLSVHSNGVDPIVAVPLFGSATLPAIRLDPGVLSFQSDHGEPVTLTATLESVGTADLVVSAAVLTGAAFEHTFAAPVTLSPGESAPVEVTYTPTAEGESVAGELWFGTNTAAGYAVLPLEGHQGPTCVGLGEAWDRGFLEPHTNSSGTDLVIENHSADETVCVDRWYVFLAEQSQDLGAGDMEYDIGGDYPYGTIQIPPGGSHTFDAARLDDASWWCLELEQHTDRNKPYTFTGARVPTPAVEFMTGADQQSIWDYQDTDGLLVAARGTNYVEVPETGGTAAIEIRPFNMGSEDTVGELWETVPAGYAARDFSEAPSREFANSDGSTTYVFDLDLRGRVHTGSSSSDTWYDERVVTYTLDVPACVGRQYLPVMETHWTDGDGVARSGSANPLVVRCLE